MDRAAMAKHDGCSAPTGNLDLLHAGVELQLQVGPTQVRLQKSIGSTATKSAPLGKLCIACTFLLAPVVVGVERIARGDSGFHERLSDCVRTPNRSHV